MVLPSIEISMAKYILKQKNVHYDDISQEFNISRPTVNKYLNQLNNDILEIEDNVKLVRSRLKGIYFEGNFEILEEYLDKQKNDEQFPETPEDRQIYIIATLIFQKNRVSINKLAQSLFVSRRTIEADLAKVRNFISENGGELLTNNGQLEVKLSEKIKFPFLIGIFHKFFGENLVNKGHKDGFIPPVLSKYLNQEEVSKIFKMVNEFISNNKLHLTDYEYETLIIYLNLQLTLNRNNRSEVIQNSNLDFEVETFKLSEKFSAIFGFFLDMNQLTYLNSLIVLIKLENKLEIIDKGNDLSELKIDIKNNLNENYDNQLIEGLFQHLSGAIRRAQMKMYVNNPYVSTIKQKFPLAFEESLNLINKLSEKNNIELSEDEVGFVALHFESYFERKNQLDTPLEVAIVCNTGVGTSRLLEEKINQSMRNVINVRRILVSHEVPNTNFDEDLIISTIPIDKTPIPAVIVSPFLLNQDREKILEKVNEINASGESFAYFSNLFSTEQIFIQNKKMTYQNAIIEITKEAMNSKKAITGLTESALKRESFSSTAVRGIALPHADTKFIKNPFISVMINKKGIVWQGELVKIVFFMGLNETTTVQIRKIYHYLNEIIESNKLIRQLESSKTKEEILKILTGKNL